MTINNPQDELNRINVMSSHSISLQDLATASTSDSCGDSSSFRSNIRPITHVPQHEQLTMHALEDFSENSEDLFAAASTPNKSNNNIFAHSSNGSSSSSFGDVNFDPDHSMSGDENESWTSHVDYNDDDEDDNSWMFPNTISDDDCGTDSDLLQQNSAPAGFRLSVQARRKEARGPLVWVLRDGIDVMEQAARLVLPRIDPSDDSDYEEDAHEERVEIQWRNDGSFDWVSREEIRLVQERKSFPKDGGHSRSSSSDSGASFASLPPSRTEMMQAFQSSGLSLSGRRIMQIQNNIITSDAESSDTSSSGGSVEEENPTLGRKLGNMMGFRSSSTNNGTNPKRPSSVNIKNIPSSAGDTPARKRSLPAFPLSSPLRRSNSLGKSRSSRSPPPPPITLDDALVNEIHDHDEKQLLSSSFHHEQRRARKGAKKQAFKSRSADSMPAELNGSPIIVQAKKLTNSMHNPSSASKQHEELKSSSYHHEQRKARKGSKQKATKSRSADSQPADFTESPTITEAKSLWQELHASSPEMAVSSLSPLSSGKKKSSNFHHEERKKRKGGKRKASKSRSADSQPAEMMESPVIAEAKSLSSSMHNLIKPESMKVSSYHHEQRKARKQAEGANSNKTKQTKSRSADSMPAEMDESPIFATSKKELSNSMHGSSSGAVPRRKNSLSKAGGFLSPSSIMKRSLGSITTKLSPKISPKSGKGGIRNSEDMPKSSDCMTPEQVTKKKSAARKSESDMIGSSPNSRRNTSLRRSEGDVVVLSPDVAANNPKRVSSINRNDDAAPKRNSSLKRNDVIPDPDFSSPKRNSSLKRSGTSPKRNSSLRNKSPKLSNNNKEDNSGIAYLQQKRGQQQTPSRRSGASALSSPRGSNDEPRRVANVDSAISMMMVKGSRSARQLDGIADDPAGRKRVSNVDSAILLMKKQTSQRKLDATGESKGRQSPRQSAASRLLATRNAVDLPSPPMKMGSARRFHQSSGSILDKEDQDLNDSFVARADKLQISPNQAKRVNAKSKFEALNDKMSMMIGVEASPGTKLQKKDTRSTLREKRAAKRQSRTKLTNAFQRIIQPDGTEKTTDKDSNGIEVPVNN
ncbi:unnamed protein product [Cylindrotheca closterium]|uniref:Uncharacterized protein n=1 Tax=Cylindrotheca closterium TaxID=2856 RepID=A0AAD2FR43_9STRA|nr:unnamed protein product [Cylindrotheca closterium]